MNRLPSRVYDGLHVPVGPCSPPLQVSAPPLPCRSVIEGLSSKFLRARDSFRSFSAQVHLDLPLKSDFSLGISCDGVSGDFKHVCSATSQEQYIELARFVAAYEASPRSAVQAFAFPAFAHFNAEQRDRCDRAEKVHQLSHISDDLVCESLSNGGYRWANITPADVRLNRTLRGRCPQCAEAKHHAKPMPPSLTAPATCVGECISIDIHTLRVKSKGGNTVSIHSLDEYSGDHQITPAVSMRSVSIFDAIMYLVHRRYNAFGHAVRHIVADSDPVLLPPC